MLTLRPDRAPPVVHLTVRPHVTINHGLRVKPSLPHPSLTLSPSPRIRSLSWITPDMLECKLDDEEEGVGGVVDAIIGGEGERE